MNGYEAYQIFQAVRLHFTSDSFDYFKYNGKTRTSLQSFETKKDKYSYHKLARMCSDSEMPYYVMNGFLNKEKVWIRDIILDEMKERYVEWTKRQQSRMYFFKEDLCKLENHDFGHIIRSFEGQNPELLNLVYQNEISSDTLIILDLMLNLLDSWSKKINDDFIWKNFERKMKKYKPFFLHYSPISIPLYKKELMNILTTQT
jgi:hypothetical protein